MEAGARGENDTIRVQPICATYWTGSAGEGDPFENLPDLSDERNLEQMRAKARGHTVWIEAYLDGLTPETREWFEGAYPVWESMENPTVDWSPMAAVFEAVDLTVPNPRQREDEHATERMLRAIPYVYTRGTFGTIRDALSDDRVAERLQDEVPGEPLTAFPAVGLKPQPVEAGGNANGHEQAILPYLALRTVVAVVRQLVITVRLPDLLCAAGSDLHQPEPRAAREKLTVPRRFLPLQREPRAPEVAEAIGIHQATTARAVASKIRERLQDNEQHARRLNEDPEEEKEENGKRIRRPELHDRVVLANRRTDELAELAHQVDRHIAQILRRFGGEFDKAPEPARHLVPQEVERRYRFALDDVRQLHEDCRLTSQFIQQNLSAYEEGRRAQFQFIAALLASIVLIPTLIAGVFGANFNVPAHEDPAGFPAFLVVVVLLGAIAFFTLWMASRNDWSPPLRNYLLPVLLVLAILAGFAFFLVGSEDDSEGAGGGPGAAQTTNFPST